MARGTLYVNEADGRAVGFSVYCASYPAYAVGERFSAEFLLTSLPEDAYRMDRLADKTYLQAEYLGSAAALGQSSAPEFFLYHLRTALAQRLYRYLPRTEGGIAAALLLGDRSGLDDAVANSFRTAGVSHLLAVSGFHLSLLCGLLLLGLGNGVRFYRPAILLQMAFTIFYMLLTGCSPSILRAGCVFLYAQLGYMLLRPPELFTGTGLVLLFFSLPNAYAVCDVGLQLSVCAVLGVALSSAAVQKFRDRLLPEKERRRHVKSLFYRVISVLLALLQVVLISVFAALATLPVLLAHGMNVSGAGVLTNLLITWMLAPALLLSALCLGLSFVPFLGPCMHSFSFILGILLHQLCRIVSWCAALPIATLCPPRRYTLFVFLVAALVLLLFYSFGRLRSGVLCTAGLVLLAVACGTLLDRNVVRVAMVGNASSPCAVVTQNGSAVVLFRGGAANQKAVLEYLAERGAPQETLLIDLRQNPRSLDFSADEVFSMQETETYLTQLTPLPDVSIQLCHTQQVNLAVLEVKGYHIGMAAGSSDARLAAQMDLYLAGSSYPGWAQADAVLFTLRQPRWLSRCNEELLYYSYDTPVVTLRPGRSVIFEEAQRYVVQ